MLKSKDDKSDDRSGLMPSCEVPANSTLQVLEIKQEWYHLKTQRGESGWLHRDWIRLY
jgi:hypothetical protein